MLNRKTTTKRRRKKKRSVTDLHDVIFEHQRVDAEARHAGDGDPHDANQRERLSRSIKCYKAKQKHIQVISSLILPTKFGINRTISFVHACSRNQSNDMAADWGLFFFLIIGCYYYSRKKGGPILKKNKVVGFLLLF